MQKARENLRGENERCAEAEDGKEKAKLESQKRGSRGLRDQNNETKPGGRKSRASVLCSHQLDYKLRNAHTYTTTNKDKGNLILHHVHPDKKLKQLQFH